MKKIIISLSLFLSLQLNVFAQGIIFETGTFAEVLEKAQKKNKLIFLDFYTDWCVPCKTMDSDVFTSNKVGSLFNSQFISIKINAEKGEGPELAKKYNVNSYPTLFFLNPDGSILDKIIGLRGENEFLDEVKELSKASEYGGILKMQEEFEAGRNDESFLKDFFSFQPLKAPLRAKIAERYILNVSEEKFMSEKSDDILFLGGENGIFHWLHEWNNDAMIRIFNLLEKKVSDVDESYKLKSNGGFSSAYNIGVVFGIELMTSNFMQQAIDNNDKELLENTINLQQKRSRKKLSRDINGDGDVNVFSGRGLFFASPDFIRLYFMAQNRNNPKEFKSKVVPYIEQLMFEKPLDSISLPLPRNIEEQCSYSKFSSQIEIGNAIWDHDIAINTFISLTNYYWRIMPNDKKTKTTIAKWLNYIVSINPYLIKGVKKATPLLIKIGHRKDAISNLQRSVDLFNKYASYPAKYTKELEDMIEDIKNDKI